MRFICMVLKLGRCVVSREQMGMKNPLDFEILTIEVKDAQEDVIMF